jgi:hypothetical protein
VARATFGRTPGLAVPSSFARTAGGPIFNLEDAMIRRLSSRKFRLYSRKQDPKTGKRRNLGTFSSRAAAEKHERAVQYFKRG